MTVAGDLPDLTGLRVVAVHAHPDDETILTGGTLALLAAAGAEVVNVTCTLGEEGEILGELWQGLAAADSDQLGGYRAAELSSALRALGVSAGPVFLGGAGTWRDSGMQGMPSFEHPRAFSRPDPANADAQSAQLAELIDSHRPHLVLTYDPVGWYGHPDHIRAHELTYAAAERAEWAVPRIAWIVVPIGVLEDDARAWEDPAATGRRVPEPPLRPAALGELPGWPDEEVTHVVDLPVHIRARRDSALAAHATQLQLHPAPTTDVAPTHLALTNNICQQLSDREHYVAFDLADTHNPAHDAGGAARTWRRRPLVLDPASTRPAGESASSAASAASAGGENARPPVWEGLGAVPSESTEGDRRG